MSKLFEDLSGVYRLHDYNQNHSELLFRRHKGLNNEFNLDVLFKGVYSLNTQILFKGLTIYRLERKGIETCINMADRKFVFVLEDKASILSYIDAAAFGIFENQLEYNESSIGSFTWSENNKLIFWSETQI